MKKRIVLMLSIVSFSSTYSMETSALEWPEYDKNWDNKTSEEYKTTHQFFFDTKYLSNPISTENLLCKYGFKKVSFTTPDNITLECLQRSVEDPSFTFIVTAGFFPGVMSGMATLVPMLPKNCNIIFYNNRGKGSSQGSLWSSFLWKNLRNYGADEYQDLIGALNHVQQDKKKVPLFLYGLCAGAFHTTKALCELDKQDTLSNYNIQGLILDSSVTSIQVDLEKIPDHQYPGTTFCNTLKRAFLWFLRYTIFRRCFMASEETTTVSGESLAKTHIPTLHIYCKKGDRLTPYERTNTFYEEHKKHSPEYYKKDILNTCFEQSSHALHHLKHKEKYAPALAGFIKKYLEKK